MTPKQRNNNSYSLVNWYTRDRTQPLAQAFEFTVSDIFVILIQGLFVFPRGQKKAN